MPQDSYQLAVSAAAVYEDQKVSAIFAPLARATLEAMPLFPGDRLLDVACGTGIVARTVRERFGSAVAVTGADLSAGMIRIAQDRMSRLSPPVDWHIADVTDMPFGDGSFSVCLCQQGVQFFPDKPAALAEIARVLQPEGRLGISVWDGASPFFLGMADALRDHIGEDVAALSLAPFAFDARQFLPPLLADAGFRDISRRSLTIDRILTDPETSIPREIFGTPVGDAVRAAGPEGLRDIVAAIMSACAAFNVGGALVIPQRTHLFTATKQS